MLHILKLAVGVSDIADLADWQAKRVASGHRLCHRTRNHPRRATEITAGGSLYWVIQGALCVRQRITGIAREEQGPEVATRGVHTRFDLDPLLVPVTVRLMRPFQGWRYLEAASAPADQKTGGLATEQQALPPELRAALQQLCLL